MANRTAKKSSSVKSARTPRPEKNRQEADLRGIIWRVERLERQVKTLTELVRDHAEDADRLVRIVGEDHELLQRQLRRKQQEALRHRKRVYARARLVP